MTTFTVYSINEAGNRKVKLGTIVERRRMDRGNNIAGLMKLAANRFKTSPGEKLRIEGGEILVEL